MVLQFEQKGHTARANESPEFLLEEQEFQLLLEKAINDLSEGQRIVFLMNRIDRKTYKGIVEILEISVKAVEKRMPTFPERMVESM